jgi:ribose transport system permease protein
VSSADLTAAADRGRRLSATVARLNRDFPLAQLLVLAAIFVYGALTLEGFSSVTSVKSMLLVASFLGLAALGQTVLILLGYFDLSVPGFIALGNVLVAILVGEHHWPFIAALALIVAVSIAVGATSGLICHHFRVEPIVVTIGVNFILIGLIDVISMHGITGAPPAWMTRFASVNATTLGIGVPPLLVLWVVVALLIGIVLRRTLAGRRVYLTGSNPAAAELALVRTRRVVIAAFALSAISAAITGVLLTGFSGTGDPSIGNPYLFTSLTAIILGGTTAGARGDYWRTMIGAVMLTVINTVLLAKGYSAAAQQILFGLIIFVVAVAYARETRLRDQV